MSEQTISRLRAVSIEDLQAARRSDILPDTGLRYLQRRPTSTSQQNHYHVFKCVVG
jgi:hypothetical protein